MSQLIKIAVDAMGGDGSPKKIIDGLVLNNQTNKENFFKIFGNQDEITRHLNNRINRKFYELISYVKLKFVRKS